MPHIVLTLAEWREVAYELRSAHRSDTPTGLGERLHAFFQEAPRTWQDRPYAIDLDATSVEVVWEIHAIATSNRLAPNEHRDDFLAAMQIIYQHHHLADDSSPVM